MIHIDQQKIFDLLADKKISAEDLDRILAKAKSLKRLSLEETACLLKVDDSGSAAKIFEAASYVKDRIYGRRVVLFAPLYISNICANACRYCAFKSDNALTKRKVLTIREIKSQVEWLLKRGHKRILVVAGEAPGGNNIDHYVNAIKAVYSANAGLNKIKRVNINCAPLGVDEFERLKQAGIGTYQIFQETYHEQTYRYVHPAGPKSDPDNRIDAVDRAFTAGIDDVGIGVLYGLFDWKFETLAMQMHIEYLEKKFGIGPHTISVPRIEPAAGVDFTETPAYRVSDEDFKKIVAVLRLAVPYTGIILSTRETPQLRDKLFSLGVSQISAESRTSPGGYTTDDNNSNKDIQFSLGDQRTLEQVIDSLLERNFIPSFCAACYRKERTGQVFMSLAKPGNIKNKCTLNALITLKEYLDDFASEKVKDKGYLLIEKSRQGLNKQEQQILTVIFERINEGKRDEFI